MDFFYFYTAEFLLYFVAWKIEKLQHLLWITSFKKTWHSDVPQSSRPRQHIKIDAFKNSTWWAIAIWKI